MHLTVPQLLDLVRNPLSGFGVLRVELGLSGLPEIYLTWSETEHF
jgi:hypothetical protein